MNHDTLLDLSRWQWALTAAMHITFPALTVGTSIFMVVCYAMYMRTDDEVWLRMFRFWRRIFGIGFALGVVSGIVLTFEFGLNWGRFAHDVGPIVGVIIAMEVVTAFFLEAGFLGLLVYGEGRIGQRMMLFATCMVTLGTTLSVTWILVANSWMQTPDGYKVVDGQFQPVNWLHVIFNPSFGIRFVHMLVGALIAAAWFIAGVSAWYLIKRRHLPVARRGVSVALGVLALLVPVQMFIGDHVAGDYVFKYKAPQGLAMEGNWNSGNTGENFIVIPNQGGRQERVAGRGPVAGQRDCQGLERPHRDPRPEAGAGPAAAGDAAHVLRLPPDVVVVSGDAGGRDDRHRAAPARTPVQRALVPQAGGCDGAERGRGDLGGLGAGRDRPPALARVREAAHRRCGFTAAPRGGADHADRIRPHLPRAAGDVRLVRRARRARGTGRRAAR
jgi:hypothetical protein